MFKATSVVYILGDVKDLIDIYKGNTVKDTQGKDVNLDTIAAEQTFIMFNGCVDLCGIAEPFSKLLKKNSKDIYNISLDLNSNALGNTIRLQIHNKQVNLSLDHRYMGMTIILDKNIRINFEINI